MVGRARTQVELFDAYAHADHVTALRKKLALTRGIVICDGVANASRLRNAKERPWLRSMCPCLATWRGGDNKAVVNALLGLLICEQLVHD
jgi:hypothetical protein